MITSSIRSGLQAIRQRPLLALLIFLVHAALGYLISAPIGGALATTFAEAGIDSIDVELLADIPEVLGSTLATVFGLIGFSFLLLFFWSSALGVGLVEALRQGGGRSFWRGVENYFWRSTGLTALFVVPAAVWGIGMLLLAVVFFINLSGEVVVFWTVFVGVPSVLIMGLAALDLALDYARIALVQRDLGVFEAAGAGFRFGLGRWSSQAVYLFWYVPSLVLLLLPIPIETALGASFGVYLLQQLVLLGRAGIGVAWIGSEVALYESHHEMPAIAGAVESTAAVDGTEMTATTA
ncbi:MAG: hypothetical protein HKN29_10900 [Rhodothermales bacterium]|nr:hypothetical protein [Rhodothermales bacterium]